MSSFRRRLLLLLLLHLLSATTANSTTTLPGINVWPKPTSVDWSNPSTFSPLHPSFRILLPYYDPLLSSAARRYLRLLLSEHHSPLLPPPTNTPLSPPLISLHIHFSSHLHDDDESYTLVIPPAGPSANLSSSSFLGFLRGLETFSQLAISASGGDPILLPRGLQIRDAPLFRHRGLLIDTSRNFYPIRDLKRTISAMAMNKLNVLHWHLTDSHSFSVVLPTESALGEKGSYGKGMSYSAGDVRKLVSYAARRGIRVVPEFDAPGHTASWAKAYPEMVTCADRFWSPQDPVPLAAEPGTGQLNPLHPKTYEVYNNVLRDAAELFPDEYLHAGGDEVSTSCWAEDPSIRRFLDGGGTHSQLLERFVNFTHPFITGTLGRTAVYWEDVLTGSNVRVEDPSLLPSATTILQTWSYGLNSTRRLVAAGYRVIVSSADYYYLDCGFGGWLGNDSRYGRPEGFGGSWCEPFKTWQRVYDYDITEGMGEEEKRRVLGGEVALWSEQADAAVVDSRLWPRAAAFAEAMWSGNTDEQGRKRYAAATDRLHEWRQRMVRRGLAAEPIQPLWCVYNPGMCNLFE